MTPQEKPVESAPPAYSKGKSTKKFGKSKMTKAVKGLMKPVMKPTKEMANVLLAPVVQNAPKRRSKYTFEQLEAREKRRRAILLNVEKNFYSILLHVDGTVISFLFKDLLFWFTCASYVAIRIWSHYDSIPTVISELGGANANVAVIGGFISFFLVLYVNKSHSRYFSLYDLSMSAKARVLDIATLAKAYMTPEVAGRLVRYMNAAHVAAYVGLSKTYDSNLFFEKVKDDFGLLTDQEWARLKQIDMDNGGGSCTNELIVWCLETLKLRDNTMMDVATENTLRTNILQFRGHIGKIFNDADLPIPFFYVHFISVLAMFYLPLFSISSALRLGTDAYWTTDVVTGLVVVLQAIFITGLRILGQTMSNPYGDDLIDFSVMHFCSYTWVMSNRILGARPPSVMDQQQEYELDMKRLSVGEAFENELGC